MYGFSRTGSYYEEYTVWQFKDFEIILFKGGARMSGWRAGKCNHQETTGLHNLQNLYYDLKRKELELCT